MLPKSRRLTRARFPTGPGKRDFSGQFVSLRLYSAPSSGESRFSVVVSKKVALTAVRRNKIRRRIYDILGHARDIPGVRGVVHVRKPALTSSYSDLSREILGFIG